MCVCVGLCLPIRVYVSNFGENTNWTQGFIFNTNIWANYLSPSYLLQPLDCFHRNCVMQMRHNYYQIEWQAGKPIFLHFGWYELGLIRQSVDNIQNLASTQFVAANFVIFWNVMVLAGGTANVSFELYGNLPTNVSLLADFLSTDRLNFYRGVCGSFLKFIFFPVGCVTACELLVTTGVVEWCGTVWRM